jgi:hypothetical protein
MPLRALVFLDAKRLKRRREIDTMFGAREAFGRWRPESIVWRWHGNSREQEGEQGEGSTNVNTFPNPT